MYHMNTNDLPANWTEKQIAAYKALKASMEAHEAKVANKPSIFNNAPKGGWTEGDRIK
jgi:hypothetical protein